MFFYVEDTCLAEQVQLEQVPLTPAVNVCFHISLYFLKLHRLWNLSCKCSAY